MKTILLVISMLSVCLLFAQDNETNVLNRDSFAPNVKKVTVNCYQRSGNGDSNKVYSSNYYECDATGKWNVRTVTHSYGVYSRDTITYDSVTRTRTYIFTRDKSTSKSIIVYNKDGTAKSYLTQIGNQTPRFAEMVYDESRLLIKHTVTIGDNRTVEWTDRDPSGRVVSFRKYSGSVAGDEIHLDYEESYEYSGTDAVLIYGFHYASNGEIRIRDTVACTYDEKQNITSKVEVMDNGSRSLITTYELDTAGREVASQWESNSGGTMESGSRKITYDSQGYMYLLIEKEPDVESAIRWVTEYNEFGLPIRCNYVNGDEKYYYEWVYVYR